MSRPSTGKIAPRETIAARLEPARKKGRTVAFANGLFDLIHVGHVRLLEAAGAEADILVVGINSDASARALKGPQRPVVPEVERAEIVAGFGCVDHVCIFPEPTADATILVLRPDVHCKGTDYEPETVPERETVGSYGGRVAIVGDEKSHATRDLIREVLKRFSR